MGDRGGGRRILVVDDEEDVAAILRDILEKAGYESEDVTDGEAVFEKIREKKFDLIFLDIDMPRMSGLDVFKKLRKLGWSGKVCLMTGWPKGVEAHREDYLVLLEEGALDKILRKPFRKDDVIRAAQEILGV